MVIFPYCHKNHDTVKNSDSIFDDTDIYENLIMDKYWTNNDNVMIVSIVKQHEISFDT